MIKGYTIICFCEDWNEKNPSCSQHLMSRFSEDNDILWINSVGLRSPKFSMYDFLRLLKKLKNWTKQPKAKKANVHLYSPLVIPFHQWGIVRLINKFILLAALKSRIKRFNSQQLILWIAVPSVAEIVGRLGETISVYYCADEWSAYPGSSAFAISKLEKKLLEQVDLVIAISGNLFESKRRINPETVLVTHGVDFDHFNKAQDKDIKVPASISKIPQPVIGYYGLLEEWVDFEIIKHIAISRPDWSIVLIGKIKVDIRKLDLIKNIYFLGEKSYKDLPVYLKAFDVAILPRKVNELTKNMTPIKLLEYLSSGVPVVSSALPAVEPYASAIRIARSKEEFLKGISASLKDDNEERVAERIKLARTETWNSRAEKVSLYINQTLEKIHKLKGQVK